MSTCLTLLLTTFLDNSTSTCLSETTCPNNPKTLFYSYLWLTKSCASSDNHQYSRRNGDWSVPSYNNRVGSNHCSSRAWPSFRTAPKARVSFLQWATLWQPRQRASSCKARSNGRYRLATWACGSSGRLVRFGCEATGWILCVPDLGTNSMWSRTWLCPCYRLFWCRSCWLGRTWMSWPSRDCTLRSRLASAAECTRCSFRCIRMRPRWGSRRGRSCEC